LMSPLLRGWVKAAVSVARGHGVLVREVGKRHSFAQPSVDRPMEKSHMAWVDVNGVAGRGY
jgi:hypothetical protein